MRPIIASVTTGVQKDVAVVRLKRVRSVGWADTVHANGDGPNCGMDIQRKRTATGPYISATFTYDFCDSEGHYVSGTWYKNFSSELEARDFAARELPVGKVVVVRFNPKKPTFNALELDSWTYTNDRPTSLSL